MSAIRHIGGHSSWDTVRNNDSVQLPNYSALWQTHGPDMLWPRSSMRDRQFGGLAIQSSGQNVWDASQLLGREGKAGQRRNQIVGVTRDANGNALGGCTVRLFDLLTDTLVDKTTSDSSGNFAASTPFAAQQVYAVAYLAGTPVFGTTAILTPS